MSKSNPIAIFLIMVAACSTSASLDAQNKPAQAFGDGIIVDNEGNRYTIIVLADGNLWMGSNLKLKTSHSYCYANAEKNSDHYGRLYTWTAAIQACKLLGEGWRLPGDDEWNQLVVDYGKNSADSMERRRTAFASLLQNGGSGFGAVLGGGRDEQGQYGRLEAHGFYWTATQTDSSTAIFYNFAKGSKALFRQDGGEKGRAFSVRCIKKL